MFVWEKGRESLCVREKVCLYECERERKRERVCVCACMFAVTVTYASAALPKKLECHFSKQRNQSFSSKSVKIFLSKSLFFNPFRLHQVPTF